MQSFRLDNVLIKQSKLSSVYFFSGYSRENESKHTPGVINLSAHEIYFGMHKSYFEKLS